MSNNSKEKGDLFVSVVATVRNGSGYVRQYLEGVSGILSATLKDYEIVLVDNCSTDETTRVVGELQSTIKNIQLYCLAAPLRRETDVLVGIEQSIGDVIITMDPRMDPPEMIVEMIKQFQAGFEIVYGVRSDRVKPSRLYDRLVRIFFDFYQKISGVRFPSGASGYRLMSRRIVNSFLQNPDRYELFPVVTAVPGFPYAQISYDRAVNLESNDTAYLNGLSRAFRILLLGSNYPLRLLTFASLGGAFLSLLYSIYVVVTFLVKRTAEGWATLSLQVSGLFFLVFVILSVVAEYIYRIVLLQQNRSAYMIARESASRVYVRKNELNVHRELNRK